MLTDRYGLSLGTESSAARDAYVEGVDRLLAGASDMIGPIERAIALDPGFALAHAARARLHHLDMQPAEARAVIAHAESLAAGCEPRERSHVDAIAAVIRKGGNVALERVREHLAEYPRDAMVLAPCCGVFGLIGFSGRVGREQELTELLESLAEAYGEDWWFRGALAFAQVESGALAEAERNIERAYRDNVGSAHNAHIRAHVYYEQDRSPECLRFVEDWLEGYARDGQMHCHLSWHRALGHLDAGALDAAWRVYEDAIRPGSTVSPPINVLSDAAAFLWRAELAGAPRRAEEWRRVRDYAREVFPRAGITFVDVHHALACAASGDHDGLQALLEQLRERDAAGKLPAGPIVGALGEGFDAYARGDWAGTARCMAPYLEEHERIGGSRAQRDLIEFTLISAYRNAGLHSEARALLERRPPARGKGV